MAEAIRSALLVDYEGLHRSLAAGGHGDARLADRAAAWVAAIETGRLIGPEGTRRRLLLKRCYAGPSVLGKQRDALSAAGFDVVDCGANDGSARSSADLYLAMDTIDALGQPNGAEEFILLTAASELAPLLTRLKASKRLTTIYADAGTPESDKALADALLDEADFTRFLASEETPVSETRGTASASDRVEIEAFARKIHSATNIPLFSPKTYAELFKHLTDEINENGYHFQTTAKNVAERMTLTGRNVTRRQVVFIVKGLALKGHVFSTTDTPDGLAEVFREQARYLITNAGIALDPRQEQLLGAWFVSRAPAPPPPAKAKAPAAEEAKPPPRRPPEKPPVIVAEKQPQARPTVSAKPPIVKPVELPKSTARPPPPTKPPPLSAAREEAKAVIAARIAASAKLKPGARLGSASKTAQKPIAPSSKSAQPQKRTADQASEALESSILAAIAEAVDVLVENGADEEAPSREPPARRAPSNNSAKMAEPQPSQPADDEDAESGDIGDQIQRIIASYNRNRTDE